MHVLYSIALKSELHDRRPSNEHAVEVVCISELVAVSAASGAFDLMDRPYHQI